MPLIKPDYDRVIVPDVNERPCRVKVVAAVLEELQDVRETLADALEEGLAQYDGSFATAYAQDDWIKGLCDRVLQLAGLRPELIDLPLLCNLVFGWHDKGGEFHEGIIFRLARGEASEISQELQADKPKVFEDQEEPQTLEQYVSSLRTRAVTLGLAQDLQGADALLERYTADELEIMLDQRWRAVDPKGHKKATMQAAAKKVIAETLEQAAAPPGEAAMQQPTSAAARRRTLQEVYERSKAKRS